MELKIQMLKSMVFMNKQEAVYQIDHSPSERRLIFHTVSHEIAFSGSLYDKLVNADTMYDVIDIYEFVAFQ